MRRIDVPQRRKSQTPRLLQLAEKSVPQRTAFGYAVSTGRSVGTGVMPIGVLTSLLDVEQALAESLPHQLDDAVSIELCHEAGPMSFDGLH